jgi:gluconokinase
MSSQQPLEEEDRFPWLVEIEDDIRRAIARNRETVMTCSALKASYRKQLSSIGRVQLVWVNVSESLLEQRLAERPKHYMKSEMLLSQIVAFESISPEENVITINGNLSLDAVITELMIAVIRQFPSMDKPWWKRYTE